MNPRKTLAAVGASLALILSGCAIGDATSDTGSSSAATSTSSTSSTSTATTSTTATDVTLTGATSTQAADSGGAPGGEVTGDSTITSTADLDALVQTALGDASLGLHRGHQPIESVLDSVLGITHAELHARMDAGQNLAAVADDLGVGAQTLIDALVADYQPAIDQALADGIITDAQAQDYHDQLVAAFTARVTYTG